MRPFDYASPTAADQVSALLGKSWGEVEILAGGSDLLSLMKDEITTPKRLVNIKTDCRPACHQHGAWRRASGRIWLRWIELPAQLPGTA